MGARVQAQVVAAQKAGQSYRLCRRSARYLREPRTSGVPNT